MDGLLDRPYAVRYSAQASDRLLCYLISDFDTAYIGAAIAR